jgi:Protein of unknown function (DUF3046)
MTGNGSAAYRTASIRRPRASTPVSAVPVLDVNLSFAYGRAMTRWRRRRSSGRLRLTEFQQHVEGQFGTVRAMSPLMDHVLTGLGGRTGAQASEDGVEQRDVRRALRADVDVPAGPVVNR